MTVVDLNAVQATATAAARAQSRAEREYRSRQGAALRMIQNEQQTAREAIRQAEAKATSLLTLFGAALAAALVVATRNGGIGTFATVALVAATLPLLGSVLALLSVLRARLLGKHGFGKWAALARHPEALVDRFSWPMHCQVQAQANRLADLARVAEVKFRRVNVAVALLAAGLPLLVLAALTAGGGR